MSDLSALLVYELGRTVMQFEVVASVERAARLMIGDADYPNQEALARELKRLERDRRARNDELTDVMRRFNDLGDQVRSVVPQSSSRWRSMKLAENDVQTAIIALTMLPDTASEEQSDQAGQQVRSRLLAMRGSVEPLANSMRPPRPIRDILRARALRRWRAITRSMGWPYERLLKRMRDREMAMARDVVRAARLHEETTPTTALPDADTGSGSPSPSGNGAE